MGSFFKSCAFELEQPSWPLLQLPGRFLIPRNFQCAVFGLRQACLEKLF